MAISIIGPKPPTTPQLARKKAGVAKTPANSGSARSYGVTATPTMRRSSVGPLGPVVTDVLPVELLGAEGTERHELADLHVEAALGEARDDHLMLGIGIGRPAFDDPRTVDRFEQRAARAGEDRHVEVAALDKGDREVDGLGELDVRVIA